MIAEISGFLNWSLVLKIIYIISIYLDIIMCFTLSAFFSVIKPLYLTFSMYSFDFWIKTVYKSTMRCIQQINSRRLSRNWG